MHPSRNPGSVLEVDFILSRQVESKMNVDAKVLLSSHWVALGVPFICDNKHCSLPATINHSSPYQSGTLKE